MGMREMGRKWRGYGEEMERIWRREWGAKRREFWCRERHEMREERRMRRMAYATPRWAGELPCGMTLVYAVSVGAPPRTTAQAQRRRSAGAAQAQRRHS